MQASFSWSVDVHVTCGGGGGGGGGGYCSDKFLPLFALRTYSAFQHLKPFDYTHITLGLQYDNCWTFFHTLNLVNSQGQLGNNFSKLSTNVVLIQ